MRSDLRQLFLKWSAGFSLSVLLIWSVTAVFTENAVPEVWSDQLKRNVPSKDWTKSSRREGWGKSHIGDLGLIGTSLPDISEKPKLLIWGDSFVEAYHVSDPEKMHRQFNALHGTEAEGPLSAVSIGESWWSVADYLFRIPDYETALDDVRLHVIHLYTLEDVFPDQYSGARVSLFLSEPNLHFEKYDNEGHEIESPELSGGVESLLLQLRLQFFLHLRTNLTKIARLDGLRFSPGIARKPTADPAAHRAWSRFLDPSWGSAEPPLEAWRFLLRELDSVTEAPILFVYAPPTPALVSGRQVLENPEKNLADHFSSLCQEQGIGFVSLEEPFLRFLEENGRFAKGFQNSRPWEGHYNADGHRLVAEAIHSWIQENRHVVYPD